MILQVTKCPSLSFSILYRSELRKLLYRFTYSYDNESQLTGVERGISNLGDNVALEESFSYDTLGNRLTDQDGSYQYDAKSQRLTEDYKWIYSYDNNGNLIQKTSKQTLGTFIKYTFNSEKQLILIEEYEDNIKKKSFSYLYDALGRRFQKEITNHEDSTKSYSRKYLYDGQEVLAEVDESNSILAVYTHSIISFNSFNSCIRTRVF